LQSHSNDQLQSNDQSHSNEHTGGDIEVRSQQVEEDTGSQCHESQVGQPVLLSCHLIHTSESSQDTPTLSVIVVV